MVITNINCIKKQVQQIVISMDYDTGVINKYKN